MNKVNESTRSTIPSAETMQLETEFAEFYYGIISKLYDLQCRQIRDDIKSALRNMRRFKHKNNISKEILFARFFSFQKPSVRCAYLYAYSVLHSVMIYSEFSNFLELNKKFLLPVCRSGSLKMCCFGGSPGIEVVAICKALNDIIMKSWPANVPSLLDVHFTMIDKFPHWRREESELIDAVNNRSNILHPKRIVLNSDFMKADILQPFDKSLEDKIKEVDIVTFFKLSASVQEQNPADGDIGLQEMMSRIADNMREDSCLFMLDNAGGSVIHIMKGVLQEKKHPSRLRSSLHKDYVLGLNTVRHFEDLLESKKDTRSPLIIPTVRGKISSCLWIKNTNVLSEKKVSRWENTVETSDNYGNTLSSLSLKEKGEDTPICNGNTSFRQAKSKVTELSIITKTEKTGKSEQTSKKKKEKKNEYVLLNSC